MYPQDYRYSKEHEWVKVDGDVATVGITDFAQEQLGDIVDLVLPDVGKSFGKDDALGEIDSVKAASDIYCPISGEITEVNQAVLDAPEKVNEHPHDQAWLVKLRIANPSELDGLMDAAAYAAFIKK